MNLENKKPVWLLVYYAISAVLFIFGIMATLVDKSGFAILATGPIMLFAVSLSALSYFVYRSRKKAKKILANITLWVLFVLSVGLLMWQSATSFAWYKTVTYIISSPLFLGELFLCALIFVLIVILNKRENN